MQHTRRNFIKNLSLATAAGCLVLQGCKKNNSSQKITILHTNDVHSHIDPFPLNHAKYPGMGGYARRAALVKKIRREEKYVVLLDSGDIFQGTPYFNFYKGELDIKLMNQMNYDAATIGNHEFDNGVEELAIQLEKANFKVVNCNYSLDQSPLKNLITPYTIIKKGAIKLGIIGLGVELKGLVNPNHYGAIQYVDPIKSGDKTAKQLKTELDCDYVIALSHLGYQYQYEKVCDLDVAKNTEYIDMILGGHTHTYLEKPTIITNLKNQDVIINQTGWGGINLGRIDITFSKDKKASMSNHAQL